jgi:hypothetical protein
MRLPLVVQPAQRNSSADFDAKLVNAYVERSPDGVIRVLKRPALRSFATDFTASGFGLGAYYWQAANTLFTITSDGLLRGNLNTTYGTGLTDVSPETYTWSETLGTPKYLFMKNSTNAYTLTNTFVFAPVVDLNYPAVTVPGSVYLDGTTYVMDPQARIWGSATLNNPTTWSALNFLTAQGEPDAGVYLAKQLIYVVAMKSWTTEFFYNAGRPTGSPLLPVQNAQLPIGCASASSVQTILDTIYFVGQGRETEKGVYRIAGLKPSKISTPAIDRLIEFSTFFRSFVISAAGHTFYVLAGLTNLPAIAFDVNEETWYFWNEDEANAAPDVAAATFNPTLSQNYLQARTDGTKVRNSRSDFYSDQLVDGSESSIGVEVVTPNFDGGSSFVKVLARMRIVADRAEGGRLQVCWSDDDYKTWSSWMTVDLSEELPQLTDLGSFHKRAFWFRMISPTPFRMSEAELELLLGSA